MLCRAPGVHARGLAHGVISVLGSLSNKCASVGLKQSFYYQRKLHLSPRTRGKKTAIKARCEGISRTESSGRVFTT